MTKPRSSWSVIARWTGDGPVTLHCRGAALAELLARGETLTPVEYLLVGAAGCYALSLEGARRAMALPAVTFEVTAVGTKAEHPPSRLDALVLQVRIGGVLPAEDVTALVARAKELCTVTNTLAEPTVVRVDPAVAG
jgi:uncharacterized OsmC-like protein